MYPLLHVRGLEIPLYLFVGGVVDGMMVIAGIAMLRTAKGADTQVLLDADAAPRVHAAEPGHGREFAADALALRTYHLVPGMHFFRRMMPYFLVANIGISLLAAGSIDKLVRALRESGPPTIAGALGWARSCRIRLALFVLGWAAIFHVAGFDLPISLANAAIALVALFGVLVLSRMRRPGAIPAAMLELLIVEISALKLHEFHFGDLALLEKPARVDFTTRWRTSRCRAWRTRPARWAWRARLISKHYIGRRLEQRLANPSSITRWCADLTDLAVRTAAGSALLFHTVDRFDRAWGETPPYSDRYHYARFLSHLTKNRTAEHGAAATQLAMEIFGGLGFLDDFGIARLHREALVTLIWEGISNIQALDMLEAMRKKNAHEDFLDEMLPTEIRSMGVDLGLMQLESEIYRLEREITERKTNS